MVLIYVTRFGSSYRLPLVQSTSCPSDAFYPSRPATSRHTATARLSVVRKIYAYLYFTITGDVRFFEAASCAAAATRWDRRFCRYLKKRMNMSSVLPQTVSRMIHIGSRVLGTHRSLVIMRIPCTKMPFVICGPMPLNSPRTPSFS